MSVPGKDTKLHNFYRKIDIKFKNYSLLVSAPFFRSFNSKINFHFEILNFNRRCVYHELAFSVTLIQIFDGTLYIATMQLLLGKVKFNNLRGILTLSLGTAAVKRLQIDWIYIRR